MLFQGRIITIITPGETEKAVDYLLSQKILGFDTETRPSFKKGQRYEVSLLQVSTHDTCFLFRLNLTGITPAIIRLLEDKKVVKVGLSWHDDLLQLHRRAEFKAGNFLPTCYWESKRTCPSLETAPMNLKLIRITKL